ncbi:MAG: tRNA (adenosine(37)-N6)-threonylcarbamoyltransferase complex dimerization subunit type 1 TsaB [Anaerolineales bacterium]|nr:tRNA (adenosine(37)-N6)-threonylcarbamoyltransferase complex dimerization subunit type 1 TsaB [Anaerolineales bacterium]
MLLAIDTSTAQVGLALYKENQVVGELLWFSRQHHTVELAPALAELMARVDHSMKAINVIGVALGPGSFTSLRVGLSLAKGLALSRRLPVIGVPTLDIVAKAQAVCEKPLAALLQAGRKRIAVGMYAARGENWQSQGTAQVTTVDDFADGIKKPTIICGELSADERQRLSRKRKNVLLASPAQCVRRPAFLAELAWVRWQNGERDELDTLAPIYLHMGEPLTG